MARSERQTAVLELMRQIKAVFPELAVAREHRFHPERRWRFDLAVLGVKVAIEVDGGLYVRGRHTRGAGVEEDMRKYGAALELGWQVIRCSPRLVRDGSALRWVEAAVRKEREAGHE